MKLPGFIKSITKPVVFSSPSTLKIGGVSLLALIIILVLTRIPISVDYQHFMFASREWQSGGTQLYDIHAGEFYYLPWALWITIPLSLMPDWLGQAVLNLMSLVSIAWVCHLWVGKLRAWQWFLVFANLFTINLLFTAQWDGLSLLGIGLAWWSLQKQRAWLFGLGLMLAATKPVNMVIVILVLCWYGLKTLNYKEIFLAALAPVSLLVWSGWASGIDWPWRYLKYIAANPPPSAYNISLWKESANSLVLIGLLIVLGSMLLAWIVYRVRRDNPVNALLFALTANLIISPYVLTYHFIVTTPALAWISKRSRLFSLAIYGFMFWILLGVARIWSLPHFMLYPILILGALTLLIATSRREID